MSKNNSIAVLAALILSAVLLATSGSIFQPARTQTNTLGDCSALQISRIK
jgi:hypothetical protein